MKVGDLANVAKLTGNGTEKCTLPQRVAGMYLDMRGEWNLPPLDGITTAPILAEDGAIATHQSYVASHSLWCEFGLALTVPDQPTRQDAEAALATLRHRFRTFAFAHSRLTTEGDMPVIDLNEPPGLDESAALCGLFTAVTRPSLHKAPGMLITAPSISGAGAGKGLLARTIAMIAFGIKPHAVTAGHDRAELDKRLGAELLDAGPMLFLDNLNGTSFIAVTGNGLSVAEDLARRFIHCVLDPKTEDPESRPFPPGFAKQIERDRADLLSAVLTIWRWGRQNPDLRAARPLGSFETWARWARDPLLALGCADPVERIAEAKANDPNRRRIADLLATWYARHGDAWLKVTDLDDDLAELVDPGGSRQSRAAAVARLLGTQIAGFTLDSKPSSAKWAPTQCRVTQAGADLRIAA